MKRGIFGTGSDEKKGGLHGLMLSAVFIIFAAVLVASRFMGPMESRKVYAASDEGASSNLPSGIRGVVSGVSNSPAPGKRVNRIGTSCENLLVGQRVSVIGDTTELNMGQSIAARINDLDSKTVSMAANPTIMSDTDYQILLKIVEAEAGEEDIKGRVLVANVIMNRIRRSDFPNTVTDVVFQYVNGVPQFSPTYDGSIYTVSVTDDTREAVRQALNGVDYSEGALFFIQKSAAEKGGISWFESDLKRLFKYGVHEFYTYPDEVDMEKQKAAGDTLKSASVKEETSGIDKEEGPSGGAVQLEGN